MTPTNPLRRARTAGVLALTVIASLAITTLGTSSANAVVDEPPRPAFYEAPASMPAANGALIRSEKMKFLLDPLDLSSWVKKSWRIMYRSTDRTGAPIAVTGTVMVPNSRWRGPGTRPVIGYAPGTQGMADGCAPSRQFSEGLEYEAIGIEGLLARGYAIAMPDYEGLGTVGVHTYMDRLSQGHATLDAVRAAQKISGTDLSSTSPVGLEGYSQGGGAAASAVEIAPTYAPELAIKGAFVGAVPADLGAVARNLDGSLMSAFGFFALRGLSASYDIDFSPYLNAKGVATLTSVEKACVFNLFETAFVKSETLTKDGVAIGTLMKQEPFLSIVADQTIGNIKPTVPVEVTHSKLDDTIPFAVGKALAQSWCDTGANVKFSSNAAPLHIGGMLPHVNGSFPFWKARFAGQPQASNC